MTFQDARQAAGDASLRVFVCASCASNTPSHALGTASALCTLSGGFCRPIHIASRHLITLARRPAHRDSGVQSPYGLDPRF